MALMNVEFKRVGDDYGLVVGADIARGWRRLKCNYGFFERACVEYRGDRRLHLQVTVDALPKEYGEFAKVFPKHEQNRRQAPSHFYGLQGGKVLEIAVPRGLVKAPSYFYALQGGKLRLATLMSWVESGHLPKSNKPGIFDPPVAIAEEGLVKYWLKFLAYLDPPPVAMPRDVVARDLLPFLPGGLPELGKRR